MERVDPASGRVTARNDGDALQVAFAPDAVWISSGAGPQALDPRTAATRAAADPVAGAGNGPSGIAVDGREVLVVYSDTGRLQRLVR